MKVDLEADVRTLLSGNARSAAAAGLPPLTNTKLRANDPPARPASAGGDYRLQNLQDAINQQALPAHLNPPPLLARLTALCCRLPGTRSLCARALTFRRGDGAGMTSPECAHIRTAAQRACA